MKTMNAMRQTILSTAVFFLITAAHAQSDTSSLEFVPADQVPKTGTFWLESSFALIGFRSPPLPCFPDGWSAPVYTLTNGQYLIDDTDPSTTATMAPMLMSAMTMDSGIGDPAPVPNYQKFMEQAFTVLDTNVVAASDTNLYNALINFPPPPDGPNLQIEAYSTNTALIRANHFDYSAETRDFAPTCLCATTSPTRCGNLSTWLALPTRRTAG